MSVSIHMNGRTRSQMNKPLHTHQVRLNKEDGVRALKDTDSAINPELSHMNVALMEDGTMERFKSMKSKLETISDKRVANGQKRLYKSANVFMVGTLQIGDDSLEALGWTFDEDGKKKPANEQSEVTIKNVTGVYQEMLYSVRMQPEIYGEVFSATLHFDESSPHVDFMVDILDENQPDKLVRDYLNGPKGTPKGEKLRNMQDNLMSKTRYNEETIERFGLKRGETGKEKTEKVKNVRLREKNVAKRETSISEKEAFVGLQVDKVNENQAKLKVAATHLQGLQETLRSEKIELSEERQRLVNDAKRLEKREKTVRLKEMVAKSYEKVQSGFNLLLEKFKKEHNIEKQERLNEVVEDHTPLTTQNLKSFSEGLLELEPDVPEELKLTEEDLKALEELNDLSL